MKKIIPPHINLLLEEKRTSVINSFPFLDSTNPPLSIWTYISNVPQCSYNKTATVDIFNFLQDQLQTHPEFINDYFANNEHELNQASIILSEINSAKIHDTTSDFDEYKRIDFYENQVNPRYLKLIEGCFSTLIYPLSAYQRIKRNASLEKFDIYNRVEELKKTKYSYLCENYNNTIRRGYKKDCVNGHIKYLMEREKDGQRERRFNREAA